MKKFLLLFSAAVLSVSTMWADELIYSYDYNSWSTSANSNSYDVSYAYSTTGQTVTWSTVSASASWDEYAGIMTLIGGAYNGYSSWSSGTTIVNLGGTAGKVLCLSGSSSDINTVLQKTYTTLSSDYITCSCGSQFGNIGWWLSEDLTPESSTSASGTPSSASELVKVQVTLNVYDADATDGTYVITDMQVVNGAGNISPSTSLSSSSGAGYPTFNITGTEFQTGGSWDPTKWITYTFYGWAGNNNRPLYAHIKKSNASGTDWTIFVKSVEFYCVDEIPSEWSATTGVEYTINPVESITSGITGVTADEAPACRVEGQNVTFDESAMIYSATGALVGYAEAGETTTLSKGFYVARVGGKGVKFAVQ